MADINRPMWARLDCSWRENPKIQSLAGMRGGWQGIVMYLHSITYATHHLTDGFIPITWPKFNGYTRVSIRLLVDVELWWEVSTLDMDTFEDQPIDGWVINDHQAYQISRAIWTEKAEQRRAAGIKANAVRWGSNITPIKPKSDPKSDPKSEAIRSPTQRNATQRNLLSPGEKKTLGT